MRVVGDLARLQGVGIRQLSGIQYRLRQCGPAWSKDRERIVALCLIDAQSTWSLFVRHFFLSCVLGGRLVSGVRPTMSATNISTPESAILFAIKTIYPRKQPKKKPGPLDEPPWHLPWVLPRLAASAGLSNQSQILKALAVPGRALDDLPKARNFFAHRSQRTAKEVRAMARNYRLPGSMKPGELPCSAYPNRPYSIAYAWVAQIRATIRLLPQ